MRKQICMVVLFALCIAGGADAASKKPGLCPYGLPGEGPGVEQMDIGEWWHDDDCPVGWEWFCDAVHNEHGRDRCTNGDGTIDLSCWEWSNNSPREDQVDCQTTTIGGGGSVMPPTRVTSCTVSATVHCPGAGDGTYPYNWITFNCYIDAVPEGTAIPAASGILRVDGTGHPDKGVRCERNGRIAECGCHVNSGTSSFLYGSRSKYGANNYYCNYN